MSARVGSALILLGLIALMIFTVTLSVDRGDLRLLLGGASLSALGLLLRRRAARREKVQGARFRTLRRLLGRPSQDEEQE